MNILVEILIQLLYFLHIFLDLKNFQEKFKPACAIKFIKIKYFHTKLNYIIIF